MFFSVRFTVVATIVAIAPLAAAAQDIGGENDALIDQIGADNLAAITQTGTANRAGAADEIILQQGIGNALTILQTGVGNVVGVTGTGVDQIAQSGVLLRSNRLLVEQSSDFNVVGEVLQNSEGSTAAGFNEMTIVQKGGDANRVDLAIQSHAAGVPGNEATITMDGAGNSVAVIEQHGLTDLDDAGNVLGLRIQGNGNGLPLLTGPALLSTAQAGRLYQRAGTLDPGANGNAASMTIQGNDNAFGIDQGGRGNYIGPVAVVGDRNEIGLHQDGLENDLTVSTINGDENRVGISQRVTNVATVIFGRGSDRNDVLGLQHGTADLIVKVDGDDNIIEAEQDYLSGRLGVNLAEIEATGNGNVARATQLGQNIMILRMEGDDNNTVSFDGARPAGQSGLTPGNFIQVGGNNVLDGEQTGDRNLAGTSQFGSLNDMLFVQQGDDNEVALFQFGNGNKAGVTQVGVGNSALIRQ